MVLELNRAQASARRAYERGRASHALAVATPILALVAVVAWIQPGAPFVLAVGGLLFVTGAVFVWRGQELGRGALAGVLAGLVPLMFGVGVRGYQVLCHDGMFMPGCVAACAVGGIAAGAWIAHVAARRPSTIAFVASAVGLALLTGAMGCSCAGPIGVGGMLLGLLAPVGLLGARQGVR